MTLTPSVQFGSVQEDDPFLALFPHRYDYIWADHPRSGEKPNWQTESRHPLSDRLIRQGSHLYGVRFGSKTNYCLLDIDSRSLYHPNQDPFAISRLTAALEPLGLVQFVACSSSYSGGIHLFFPFAVAQDSHKLAQAVQALLENAGFVFSSGQLELFPNDRSFVNGKPALYAAHRLPMQAGSYLLDNHYQIIWSNQETFVQQWCFAQWHNQLTKKTLERVLKTAKRKKYCFSGRANKFINDLVTEIYQGWSNYGQTNRLLGRITMYCYIFWHCLKGGVPLTGKELVNQIVEIAKSLPGYSSFCRHQHEIEHRAQEWATSIEKSRYFPYNSRKNKTEESTVEEQKPSTWHRNKQEEARERIRQTTELLLETNALPEGPTARFRLLTKKGIGGGTLYKHKDLWHPKHLEKPTPPDPQDVYLGANFLRPEYTNLLAYKSSNTLPDEDLSIYQQPSSELISNNTQMKSEGIEWVKQKIAEIKLLFQYKGTTIPEVLPEILSNQVDATTPSPKRVVQMQQWLESGDPILMGEAEAFFNFLTHANTPSI